MIHCWSIRTVQQELKSGGVLARDLVLYFIAIISLLMMGCSVFSFLPTLYYLSFGMIKSYLEHQAAPLALTIDIFDIWHQWFALIMVLVVIAGILECYTINKAGDNQRFIVRFICLNLPITVRICVLTALLYAGGLLGMFYRYTPLLKSLSEETSTNNTIFDVIKFTVKKMNVVKTVMDKVTSVQNATVLFAQLSETSFYAYCLTHVGALCSALFYFFLMRRSFKKIFVS